MWYCKMYFPGRHEVIESDAFGTQGAPSQRKAFPFLESLLSFTELDIGKVAVALRCISDDLESLDRERVTNAIVVNAAMIILTIHLLTQTVTQTRKKAGGYRRASYLHTQEVTGSSPAGSTKKVQESQGFPDFFIFAKNDVVSNVLVVAH